MSLSLGLGAGAEFLLVCTDERKALATNEHQERGAGVKQLLELALVKRTQVPLHKPGPYTRPHATTLRLLPKATGMLWHPWAASTDSGEQSRARSLALRSPSYFTTRYKSP